MSVIITTYNRAAFLKEAIASVIHQRDVDFELLVVDDGSPGTATEQVITSFDDPRVRYIKHEMNKGSTASLNTGLREARGLYVAILDDDDSWISEDKLLKQVCFLEHHLDHVLVSTNVIVTSYNTNHILVKTKTPQFDKDIRRHFLTSNPIAHSSVMYYKDAAFSVGGYDEALTRGKDYDLWLKLGTRGKIHILADHMVRYREATSAQRDILAMRIKDTKAKITVIVRHRKSYPGVFAGLTQEYFRFSAFYILRFFYFLLRDLTRKG